jgi:hypothetical protein
MVMEVVGLQGAFSNLSTRIIQLSAQYFLCVEICLGVIAKRAEKLE